MRRSTSVVALTIAMLSMGPLAGPTQAVVPGASGEIAFVGTRGGVRAIWAATPATAFHGTTVRLRLPTVEAET